MTIIDRDRAIIGSLLAILFIASFGVGIPRAASPSSTSTPVLGAQKLAVITVQFPDVPHDPSVFDAQRAFEIFDEYYRLNSYGKMWWEISISPTWYTLPQTQSYYGPNWVTEGEHAGHGEQFVLDSFGAASADFDLAQFDKVMIVYEKWGQWSQQWTYPLRSWSFGTRNIQAAVTVVSDSWGGTNYYITIEHEAGHLLGLPDLYYCVDSNCFSIEWDGMGGGGQNGNAAMFSSWTKLKLGWIDDINVKTIQGGQVETATIDALGLAPTGISVIRIPVTREQYYLVEVREAVGADANLPTPDGLDRGNWRGVFVLQVDETTPGGMSGTGIVRWINPQTQQPARDIMETNCAAFQVGESFSSPSFGVMTVNSKSGSSYQVELNRASVLATVDFYTDPSSGATVSADGVMKYNEATGAYAPGSRVHIVANPPSGYSFSNWETSSVSVDSTVSADTYMTVSASGWLKAHFTAHVYSITVSINPSGLNVPITGGGTYAAGATVGVSVGNAAGYTFVKWQRDGVDFSNDPTFLYVVDGSHTFTAVFQPIATLTTTTSSTQTSVATTTVITTTSATASTTSTSSTTSTASSSTSTSVASLTTTSESTTQTTLNTVSSSTIVAVTYRTTVTTTGEGLVMQVVSNSSVSSLVFDSTRGLLNFTVSGASGTLGFFDATIAKSLLLGQPVVFIDGVQHSASLTEDANFWYVHVVYAHSEHHVTIGGSNTVPEFPPVLPLAIIIAVELVIFRRRLS